MIRSIWLVLAVAIACAGSTMAGTIRDDRADTLYTDLAPGFPEVGRLLAPGLSCSGVLIRPTWVLTAAHCVDGVSSLTFHVGTLGYAGIDWLAHPSWDGNFASGTDLGLVQLADPVVGVTPADLNQNEGLELLRVGTSVGFGWSGTGQSGSAPPAGTKRAGDNTVDLTGAATGPGDLGLFTEETIVVLVLDVSQFATSVVFSDFDDPSNPLISTLGSPLPQNLEYLIAPGDSGGGVFLEGRLVAVHSFVLATDAAADSSYGDLMGSTSVAAHADWILAQVPEASADWLAVLTLAALALLQRAREPDLSRSAGIEVSPLRGAQGRAQPGGV